MELTKEDISEYQELYRKRFNEEIGYEKAYEDFSKLLDLMEVIYRPMTKEGFERLQKRRRELGISEGIKGEENV